VITALIFLGSAVISMGLWLGTREMFQHPTFIRRNYRDHTVPTAVGALIPLSAAIVMAMYSLVSGWAPVAGARDAWFKLGSFGPVVLALAFAFALLGLIDDFGGIGQSGGFRAHITALFRGRVSTGMLKLIGGAAAAIAIIGATATGPAVGGLIRDAAIVALAANLGNLFDRAPGRVIKVGLITYLAFALLFGQFVAAPLAPVLGAAAGLLIPDVREQMMIGDAGANALGAVIGYGFVLGFGPSARLVVLIVLVFLNLLSDFVSFSRVIERTPPLRWIDRLGAHRHR